MSTTLHGFDAIAYATHAGATLNKYADPTEGAREGLTIDEARQIATEDGGLIWCVAEHTTIRDNVDTDSIGDGSATEDDLALFRAALETLCEESDDVESATLLIPNGERIECEVVIRRATREDAREVWDAIIERAFETAW